MTPQALLQRPDLTYKHNRTHGRHGWLRLTPAYSVRLVEQLLDEFGPAAQVVFDPFSGSGTTALCAAYRGKTGLAIEINPFLVWLANIKAQRFSQRTINVAQRAGELAARCAIDGRAARANRPPLSHIERWWSPAALQFLLRLKQAIDARSPLLQVAFCRTLLQLSNAAFNHQSMSFKDSPVMASGAPGCAAFAARFLDDVREVVSGAAENPGGVAECRLSDARQLDHDELRCWRNRVDLLITSPPYPNRMSYVRELRPYMYWLQYLSSGREAGELDWQAIGGTWGIATSRLGDWAPSSRPSRRLRPVLDRIRGSHPGNGRLLANYVQKYFEDMLRHLQSALVLLKRGAGVHYIIGNSIFYGHMVEAERYLAEQMAAVGFTHVSVLPLRKRNSKQGLIEYRVSAVRA